MSYQKPRLNGVCNRLYFSYCMRAEGPWQQPRCCLSDSGGLFYIYFLSRPNHRRKRQRKEQIVNCPAGYQFCCCRGCKGEVKNECACSIPVMVGGCVFFVWGLRVLGVCPVDDCICSLRVCDSRIPPWVMCIEVPPIMASSGSGIPVRHRSIVLSSLLSDWDFSSTTRCRGRSCRT